MSRVVIVQASMAEVQCACMKENVGITALEQVPGAGTRVVLQNRAGADRIAALFKSRLIEGVVTRTPLRTR